MDVVKWGIIGCGDVAEHKGGPPLYQIRGSELVAVVRRDQEKAADFAQRHRVARWYTDVTSLLADPDINAVYIASPHYLHRAHASQSALAGKIVLCEKPMGNNRDDAQSIVDVCRTSGVPLTVAYYRRYWPVVQKMKALLAENAIGRVVSARVQLADYFDGDPKRLWLTSLKEAGGGALANAGSHWIDLIRYLLGEVTEVIAYCSSTAGFEVEDTATAIMRTETEAFVSFSSTWQERVGINDFDICGTHGRILASPLSAGRLELFRVGKDREIFELARSGPAHQELIRELITRLQTGQSSPVPGEEAVAVWRIIEATHRSNTEGCRIRIV